MGLVTVTGGQGNIDPGGRLLCVSQFHDALEPENISSPYKFSSVLNDSSTMRSRSWSGGNPTKFLNTSSLEYSRTR
jgi:hypothetical protein